MPVVVGSTVNLLFCEGKPDSYDVEILNLLSPGAACKVVASGGQIRAWVVH